MVRRSDDVISLTFGDLGKVKSRSTAEKDGFRAR